ncbi:Frazzled [Operophtera brumata]|uniref:Frazzled n=1 Tax=Operophtera brumata TaxID=104452 RepID=A0A0L7L0G6_OPEBR|nr:Frazzled [Operophtera brumata]
MQLHLQVVVSLLHAQCFTAIGKGPEFYNVSKPISLQAVIVLLQEAKTSLTLESGSPPSLKTRWRRPGHPSSCPAPRSPDMQAGWRGDIMWGLCLPGNTHSLQTTNTGMILVKKQLPNGSLVIDSMSASLAGQYQCVVTVDGVGTIVSRIATVFLAGVAGSVALLTCGMRASPRVALRVAPAPTPDRRVYGAARVHQSPPTLKLNRWRGDRVESKHRGGKRRVAAAVHRHAATCYYHGSDLDSRFYLAGSGSLRVQSARALDAGAYTCRAHSRLDSADHTTVLHVQVEGLTGGAGVVARARGDAVLRCAVRGRPPPTPLSSLRIQGVLRVDAGMFQCAATSPSGAATATVRLTVLPPDDESTLNPSSEDSDFLGETSSAYTSGPGDYYDSNYDGSFHAAEGLDESLSVNASLVSTPKRLRAVIVKHRFVTLSWEEPERKSEELDSFKSVGLRDLLDWV